MSAAFEPERFKEASRAALGDPALGATLKNFRDRLVAGRYQGSKGMPEFDGLRDLARDIKNDVLDNLSTYLERFESAVAARGGYVHWARDGEEACAIIRRLCEAAGAKSVVKSKSMVSEEVDLGSALIKAGIASVETDLGEYIIQLRGERPSHLIGPAMHLSKAQVSETFRTAHTALAPDRPLEERQALVKEARAVLRQSFAAADVGITGANFLVAETGSVVLVTNEGNADLTAALPKTHIVLTGLEKLVPTFDDAALMVRLLGRSATGQEMPSYVSVFSGPRQPGERDGPTAFHVVLLDNGRVNMLGTEFRDALRCIRCAACLNHCPVFGTVGGHGYGSVYSGPIGAVLTPALVGLERSKDLPNASSLCGRCEEVCPVRIPIPKMLRHWREREFERHLAPTTFRWGLGLWAFAARSPSRYRLAARLGRMALVFLRRLQGGRVRRLPSLAGGWTAERDMRIPPGRTFQDAWSKGER